MKLNTMLTGAAVTASLLFLTGCAPSASKNIEITIPNEKNKQIRANHTLYVDTGLSDKIESGYLKLATKAINEGERIGVIAVVNSKDTFNLKDAMSNSNENDKKVQYFYDFTESKTLTHLKIDNISLNNLIELSKGLSAKENKELIKFDATHKNDSIIINKNYNNPKEALADYINIVSITNVKFFNKPRAFNRELMLDAKMLEQNKLVLKTVTSKFDFVKKFKEVAKEYGYKITDDKKQSDLTIMLDLQGVGKETTTKYRRGTNSTVAMPAMDLAKVNGNSSGSSALIGLGVFAIEGILTGKNKPVVDTKVTYDIAVMITDSDAPNKKNGFSTGLKSVKLNKIQDLIVYSNAPAKKDPTFRLSSQQILEYLDNGKMSDYSKTVVKPGFVSDKLKHKGYLN